MCPVGMPETIAKALWEDLKEHWKEWAKFLLWEVPTDIAGDIRDWIMPKIAGQIMDIPGRTWVLLATLVAVASLCYNA